jgi:Ion transport protein
VIACFAAVVVVMLYTCDNIQVISLEGWVDIMYNIQDAHSFWSWIYFATLIVVSIQMGVLYVLIP